MASFIETVRKSDNQRRYYIGGCRVSRVMFNSLDCDFDTFRTQDKGTHWHHHKEGRL